MAVPSFGKCFSGDEFRRDHSGNLERDLQNIFAKAFSDATRDERARKAAESEEQSILSATEPASAPSNKKSL